jgi:hypothetical protein
MSPESKLGSARGNIPAGKPRPAAGKPPVPASGAYVHFSDRMTDALMNINSVIDDNRSTLDSIQDMAVELTRAIRALQGVAMKYVGMADDILETIVPVMEGLPIFPQRVKDFAKEALVLAKKIAAASELAERVLPGVEAGLTTADMTRLQASTGEVANLTRLLQSMRD